MGLLPPEEVPPLFLRVRQGRPRSLVAGKRIKGPFVEVTIEDVIAHYGERRGPAMEGVWRRAIVIVSPERLLSRRDMAWFNFLAKRVSDPDVTGIEGLGRGPSMELATGGRVDLQTKIRPRGRAPVSGNFEVSYPKVGKRDFRGLKLDGKLDSRYLVGRRYVVSGRVSEPGGREMIAIAFGPRTFTGAIRADGRFAVEIEFAESDRGPTWLGIGLDGTLVGGVVPIYVE